MIRGLGSSMRVKSVLLFLIICITTVSLADGTENVKCYTKEVEVKAGKESVTQKRWYLENDHVRFALTNNPGGSVVEFTNKKNGVNHVFGSVYKTEEKVSAQNCWTDFEIDSKRDPVEKSVRYQNFDIEIIKQEDGNTTLKATGKTEKQKIERWHTLAQNSGQLTIRKRITNISNGKQTLWMRWHPFMLASKDNFGKSAVIMSPGPDMQVRKTKIGWGWDHWFKTYDGYWIAEDYNSGDGIFLTFEKETTPIHFTWTMYDKVTSPKKGAFTMEMFPEAKISKPGDFLETSLSFFPFDKDTSPESFPMGVLKDKNEKKRALKFLKRVKPLEHIKKFGSHTFARTEFFDWRHRRRDKFAIADWGFVDCAIVGYPYQNVPFKVRMVGGLFEEAKNMKRFNEYLLTQCFKVTISDSKGLEIYNNTEAINLKPGVNGGDVFDKTVAIPASGMPDGNYTLKVEAIDIFTRKPMHSYSRKLIVFGERIKVEEEKLANKLKEDPNKQRPFVKTLASVEDISIKNGAVKIPIGVEDGSGIKRTAFPVKLGIPFPLGKFSTDINYRLLDSRGKEVDAAFSIMNVWHDKSLKWLQVNFAADCPADGFSFYYLEAGKSVKASRFNSEKLAIDSGNKISINTGKMLIEIVKDKLSIPGKVYLDRNRNGKYEEAEQVTKNSESSDIWWLGENNKRYIMKLEGPDSLIFKPGVTIEENTSQSAIVKLQGWYFAENNDSKKTPAYGEIRIETNKGSSVFKVWHQVTFTGSPWYDKLVSYGLKMRVKENLYNEVSYDIDEKAVKTKASSYLYQSSYDKVNLFADNKICKNGEKASGAMLLSGNSGKVLFFHRELWQMFPKKLEADPAKGVVSFHYWPKEAGTHSFEPDEEYWIPSSSSAEACGTGVSRTHEITIDFSNLTDVTQADETYHEPVIAAVPPKWIQQTYALRNLVPQNWEKMPEIEEFVTEHLEHFKRNRKFFKFYGEWDYGTVHNIYQIGNYNWLVVGRYANIGNEENIVKGPWLAYFRSGDRLFFKFARLWTRHLMEVQSIRWHNIFPEFAGMSRRHHKTTWLGGGDWGHTMLCPWLEYYHATGYKPAWEMAKFTAETMKNTYKGSWRYITNPLIGEIRMYDETADEGYKKSADRIWNDLCYPDKNRWFDLTHAGRAVRFYSDFNKDCLNDWKKYTDGEKTIDGKDIKKFRYIDSLAELAERTGDIKYAHQARVDFDHYRYYTYTGMTFGINPVFRGQIPHPTQHSLGVLRMVTTAAEQIMRSKEAFPAQNINIKGQGINILVKEDHDQDFIIWISKTKREKINILGPDQKEIKFEEETIFIGDRPYRPDIYFCKISVSADNKSGIYSVKKSGNKIYHIGCSLRKVAFDLPSPILEGCGVPLYVKSENLGNGESSFVMKGAPASSLGLFTLNGKKIFSDTLVRPVRDNIGIKKHIRIPKNVIIKLKDRTGITFTEIENLRLFLNPNGIF